MSEPDIDAQVVQAMLDLLRLRRMLDHQAYDALLGSIMVEIGIGLDLAEEQALEAAHRRPVGIVVAFPGGSNDGGGGVGGAGVKS